MTVTNHRVEWFTVLGISSDNKTDRRILNIYNKLLTPLIPGMEKCKRYFPKEYVTNGSLIYGDSIIFNVCFNALTYFSQ